MTKKEYIKIKKLINGLQVQRLDFCGLGQDYIMMAVDKNSVFNILEVFVEDEPEKE